ncbi:transcriptional regulator BolA [Kingella potus]|uniref:Transcriptional regulator BolA n=1 Tax=Kingella potus TaxID=265175 RepID=A0A377R2A8_9NEIS|nr:BolA family protein [Kingella potus]UOP00314.1 BolA family transcriptional regulator [Kingella potus]STR02626.1 transcriptional regulator BolA [Kingella potus]
MQDMETEIKTALSHLNPDVFEFADESHLHAGHAGNTGGGHYRILVVSGAFENVSRIMRQRMVKAPLEQHFRTGRIHALAIRALTPDEFFNRSNP